MAVEKRRTKLSKVQVKNLIHKIPKILQGTASDRFGLRPAFAGAVAHHLFSKIHEAYMIKSRGQTDELGQKWKPIKESTKIRRLSDPKIKSKLGFGGRKRGLLTSSQDKSWKKIFAEVVTNLMKQGIDYTIARDIAAGAAWNHVKALGAPTRASVAKQVFFPAMIHSGRLAASLSPSKGMGAQYRAKKDQVYEFTGANIVLGTKVEYADSVSEERPLWPENIDKWVDEASQKGMEAIMGRIAELIS